MVSRRDRDEFDRLLDHEVARLPDALHALLDEVPLIVDDEPTPELLASLGMGPGEDGEPLDDLCGLHEGVPMTEQSVEMPPELPARLMLFRGPIMRLAGYHGPGSPVVARRALVDEIRITLLHEIGHHFGLDEADLDRLGYG
ncbi:MAG: metallopeptidase family protein [Planctomycetota bacterium]